MQGETESAVPCEVRDVPVACDECESPSSARALPSVAGALVNRSLRSRSTPRRRWPPSEARVGDRVTGTYLVARIAQSAFTAVTAVCTHEGCAVTGFTNSLYICPCHGSEFSTSGAVVQGPAGAGPVGAPAVPDDARRHRRDDQRMKDVNTWVSGAACASAAGGEGR